MKKKCPTVQSYTRLRHDLFQSFGEVLGNIYFLGSCSCRHLTRSSCQCLVSVAPFRRPSFLSISSPAGVAMTFSRSVTSLLRTSRHVASPARGLNPINRVFGHDRFGARTYATVFERTKPHVNVGRFTSGHTVLGNADSCQVQSATSIMAR